MFIIYDILCLIFTILYLPYVIIRKKWHGGFWQRLGLFPRELTQQMADRKKIWIHAVSVGEVMVVLGLARQLREKYPQSRLVVTTVTQTGYKLAQMKLGGEAEILFAPIDFSWTVRKFIRIIRPQIYITAETEIWPNLFYALLGRKVPTIIVNGRISDGAFRLYRLTQFLFAPLLRRMDAVCAQTALDAQRFIILGARPTSVFVTGNFKFDEISASAADNASELKFAAGQPVWIAGSTHPGEEQIVLDTFRELRAAFPALRLVVAPRHVERARAVADLIEKSGLKPLFFSRGVDSSNPAEVVVVDTIGHLRHLYRYADIVFVGKSLVGRGGQNILEPAVLGKPIVVGPHMENFRQIAAIFLAGGALSQVHTPDELCSQLSEWLFDPQARGKVGSAARRLVEGNQGATQKAFDTIRRYLSD